MKNQIQAIANSAVHILSLCREIGSGEYSEKGINRRLAGIRYDAKDIEEMLESLKEDKP